ncbi:MAG: hypothetical protein M0R67_05450 [Candidatus Cloacimonas sp.]|nr:hypothetical protein [Candidatus Cloacimonas sp.]
MKKVVVIVFGLLLVGNILFAQPWIIDFGETEKSILANTVSTDLFVLPSTGNIRARVGNAGGGVFLKNTFIDSLGSGMELRIKGPDSTTNNLVQVYNFPSNEVIYIKYEFLLGGDGGLNSNFGTICFYCGAGNSFSTNRIVIDSVFIGLKWVFQEKQNIITSYLNGKLWTTISPSPMKQSNIYEIELYGNNSNSMVTYSRKTTEYSINPQSFDFWINGQLIGDDFSKGPLPVNTSINAFMFSGTDNDSANCFVDNLLYSNVLPIEEDTLPVELSNFRAELDYQNRIQLMWVTQSEVNLLGYYIYRNNEDDVATAELVSPIITATNTPSTQLYVFTDASVNEAGNYHYWLQCIDYQGNEKFFGPSICRYEFPGTNSGSEIPLREGIRSIFPNPFNPCTTINYAMESAGSMELAIYNIKGQKVLGKTFAHSEKGNYKFLWDGCDEKGTGCSSGIYAIRMRCRGRNYLSKVAIIK